MSLLIVYFKLLFQNIKNNYFSSKIGYAKHVHTIKNKQEITAIRHRYSTFFVVYNYHKYRNENMHNVASHEFCIMTCVMNSSFAH